LIISKQFPYTNLSRRILDAPLFNIIAYNVHTIKLSNTEEAGR
jgi:hypothetical protein